jgi:hypothetical protein
MHELRGETKNDQVVTARRVNTHLTQYRNCTLYCTDEFHPDISTENLDDLPHPFKATKKT